MNEPKDLFLFIELSDECDLYIAEWFPICEPRTVIIPDNCPDLRVSRVAVYTEQDIEKRLEYIKGKADFSRFEFRMLKEETTSQDVETAKPEKRNLPK